MLFTSGDPTERDLSWTSWHLNCGYLKSNSMVERFNRTLIEMLTKMVRKDPRRWDQQLPFILFAYCTSLHESTSATPFKLLYGREAVLPMEELLQLPPERNKVFLGTYVKEATTRFSETWTLTQENIKKAQARQRSTMIIEPEPLTPSGRSSVAAHATHQNWRTSEVGYTQSRTA